MGVRRKSMKDGHERALRASDLGLRALPNCVILGQSLNLSEPHFLHL